MTEAFDYTPEEWAAEMERAAWEEAAATAEEAHRYDLTRQAVRTLDSYPHDLTWSAALGFLKMFAPEKVPPQFSSKGK